MHGRSCADIFRIPTSGGILTIICKFRVDGVPVPKGSTKAFVVNGRANTTNANPKTKEWQSRVSYAGQQAREDAYIPKTNRGDDGVGIIAVFRFPRPQSDRRGRRLHTVRPDLDKLIRTIGDALTGVLFDDDSQIISISATKEYCDDCAPHVDVTIRCIQQY